MGAPDILTSLKSMGLRLSPRGSSIWVEPKAAITDEARLIIREHKIELLGLLTPNPADAHEALTKAVEERAAVMEYDGGLSRADAERQARQAYKAWLFQLHGRWEWFTLLTAADS